MHFPKNCCSYFFGYIHYTCIFENAIILEESEKFLIHVGICESF